MVGDFAPVFGGSHFNLVTVDGSRSTVGEPVPTVSEATPAVYKTLHQAIQAGQVRACHDLSEGGLAVAAAEMCIAGRLGLKLNLATEDPLRGLFGETNGCLLVEVNPKDAVAFETRFATLPVKRVATVVSKPELNLATNSETRLTLSVNRLVEAWNTSLQP